MPIATVTVQYVNEPKGKGPASIKDEKGRYLKFWTRQMPTSSFRKGGTYKVEYHTEDYKGEDQYYIDEIISGKTPSAEGPYTQAPANPAKDEMIGGLALVKAMGPLPVGDVAAVEHALRTAILAYRRVVEWQKSKNIETSPRRSLKDEMEDEIPDFKEMPEDDR